MGASRHNDRVDIVLRERDDDVERHLYVVTIPSLEDWPTVVGADNWPIPESEGFALLLAMDASGIGADPIGELAKWCIEHGLFAASLWGADCERVYDVFDEIDVHLELAKRDAGLVVGRTPVVTTSWHADESLEEALDFFWSCSRPDHGMRTGPCRIALVVGNGAVEQALRRWAAARGEP